MKKGMEISFMVSIILLVIALGILILVAMKYLSPQVFNQTINLIEGGI